MRCSTLRDRGTAGLFAPCDPEVERHLAGCPRCRAYLERLALARQVLAQPLSSALPDAGFAGRVAARLPRPVELMGWAAVRLLPAALALLLGLAAYGAWHPPAVGDLWLLDPSAEQLLAWSTMVDREARP
jgi:anti-sigma factor RsiW